MILRKEMETVAKTISSVNIKNLESDSPKGDGNYGMVFSSSSHLNLESDSPKGDGNHFGTPDI